MIYKILSGLLVTCTAWSWGSLGHKVIGRLAESQLTPESKQIVKDLIGTQKIEDVAGWADGARRTPAFAHTAWYHFESIDDREKYLETLKKMPKSELEKAGVMGGLLLAEDILREAHYPKEAKINAFKFYVHFVGDIHQPLHTGRPEDNGGNKIEIKWFGNDMTLHGVWDSGIIIEGHKDVFTNVTKEADAVNKYYQFLISRYGKLKPPNNTFLSVESWMNESLDQRLEAYENRDYVNDQKRYVQSNIKQIDLRVYYAGLRLGERLNNILKGANPSTIDQQFRRELVKIVGSLDKWVSISPKTKTSFR